MDHTEGPWQVYRPEHTSGWGWGVGSKRDILATLRGRGSQAQKEADANLMAAAPDLLEACKAMREAYGEAPTGNIERFTAFRLAGDAISKAAGMKAEII